MDRITEKQLEALVNQINMITKSPMTSYTKTVKGFIPNAGNFHLDFTYGKVGLIRMLESGGVTPVLPLSTKRDLYDKLHAFIRGLEFTERGV